MSWGPEEHEQFKVVQYMKYQYPWVLFTHVPNENKATIAWRKKLKALGAQSGVQDLLFFQPEPPYVGLAIEMKSKKGKVTSNQKFWLDGLKLRGWYTCVCWSFEEARLEIDQYFKNHKDVL